MNKQIVAFLQGEPLSAPFDLAINGEIYHCSEILRYLPGKRLVVKAECNSELSIIKLFSNEKKGQRELNREQLGYQLAQKADIKLAKLQFISNERDDYCAIAYKFLEHAQPFYDNSALLTQHVDSLLRFISTMHNAGFYQEDLHLDNILISDESLYLIDLASVKAQQQNQPLNKQTSLKNLALLVVQFRPKNQDILIENLALYFDTRGWAWSQKEQDKFSAYIDNAWQYRKTLFLKKRFRSCTMTAYSKIFNQKTAFHRPFLEEVGSDFINNIDLLVNQGELLKDGNSATVVRVSYGGKQLVIKRYNIKSAWHWLKRCFRPSRAAISWRNGNLLELLGIATPRALGFIEYRFGWLRKKAYLVCEYSEGQELYDVFQSRSPTDSELAQLKDIFSSLRRYKISHGDLKASNLLLDEDGVISLIDLDAMNEHSDPKKLQKALEKDQKRFLKNWQKAEQKIKFENLFR